MINFFDAPETIALRKLIDSKKKYLATIKVEYQYQMLQREILLLEKDILPIVLNNTSVIHSEFARYVIRGYDTALQYKCNGLIIYQPIDENYTNSPIVGILNNRQLRPFGTFGAIELDIINMDANGAKIHPINLPLNPLMI